jgi:small subunit ribosomal protein S9
MKTTKKVESQQPVAASKTKKTKIITPKAGAPLSHGVGRRKSAVARVWLRRGKGEIIVNGKPAAQYFETDFNRAQVALPGSLVAAGVQYDVQANVVGGGPSGQADAVKLGLARALVALDDSMRATLKKFKLLTVDSRVKERKKYGQKAARRKFQFVKR